MYTDFKTDLDLQLLHELTVKELDLQLKYFHLPIKGLKDEKISRLNKFYADYRFKNIRRRTRFLWYPKTINDTTKWLISASWYEECIKEENIVLAVLTKSMLGPFYKETWVPIKWA